MQENIFANSGKKSLGLKKDGMRETGSMLDGKYSRNGEMVDYKEGGYRADPNDSMPDDGMRSSDVRNENVMRRPHDYVGRMMNYDPFLRNEGRQRLLYRDRNAHSFDPR